MSWIGVHVCVWVVAQVLGRTRFLREIEGLSTALGRGRAAAEWPVIRPVCCGWVGWVSLGLVAGRRDWG